MALGAEERCESIVGYIMQPYITVHCGIVGSRHSPTFLQQTKMYVLYSYNTPWRDLAGIHAQGLRARTAQGQSACIPAQIPTRGCSL